MRQDSERVCATEDTDAIWIRSPQAEAALLLAPGEVHAEYIGSEIDPVTRIVATRRRITRVWQMHSEPIRGRRC